MKNFKKVLLFIIILFCIVLAQTLVEHFTGSETSVYGILLGFALGRLIWPRGINK